MHKRGKCYKCNSDHYGRGLCRKHYRQLPDVKERELKYGKEYNLRNRDRYKIRWNKYYIKNRKNIIEQKKKYNKEHPEVMLKSKVKQLLKIGKIFDMNNQQYLYALNAWSRTIKKLDNYMCKNCSSKKNLNAHHLMPKKEFPELSLDLDNGVTLCEDCHEEIHGYDIY